MDFSNKELAPAIFVAEAYMSLSLDRQRQLRQALLDPASEVHQQIAALAAPGTPLEMTPDGLESLKQHVIRVLPSGESADAA